MKDISKIENKPNTHLTQERVAAFGEFNKLKSSEKEILQTSKLMPGSAAAQDEIRIVISHGNMTKKVADVNQDIGQFKTSSKKFDLLTEQSSMTQTPSILGNEPVPEMKAFHINAKSIASNCITPFVEEKPQDSEMREMNSL